MKTKGELSNPQNHQGNLPNEDLRQTLETFPQALR